MLLVHGRYFWRRTIVAYRNDFCLSCDKARVAWQHRTFDVLHVFWVPVLPLGFWKRWHCGECGGNPHANPRTRKGFKWLGVAALALFTLAAWGVPASEPRDDLVFLWSVRLGGPLATIWAAWATLRSPADPDLTEALRRVRPISDTNCPLCRVALYHGDVGWQCPKCGIRREELPAG
jgi:ribosomal protein S27AE